MKTPRYRLVVIASALLLAASPQAATKYHDFLLKDGRSFRGRIVAYDHHTDIVKIECADNRLIKTSPAGFDKADQLRIKEWYIKRNFNSARFLEVSISKQFFKGDIEIRKRMNVSAHQLRYIISFKNKSNIALQNMTLEYCIFHNLRDAPGYGSYNIWNKKWYNHRGVKYGKVHFDHVKPKSTNKLKTVGILNKNRQIDGIWLRITLPLSNDRNVVREHYLPDNLNKHFKWTGMDVPIGFIENPEETEWFNLEVNHEKQSNGSNHSDRADIVAGNALSSRMHSEKNTGKQTRVTYHDFLLKDGRSFRGRIVAYDQHKDIVSIHRADKGVVKTSPSVFDKADQVRIKEWHITRCFQSEDLLMIKAGRKVVKGEKWSTPSFDLGFGSGGGSSGYLRNTHYDIQLENKSSIPFSNLVIEYRIHYTHVKDKGIKCGRFNILKLEPKSKREIRSPEYIPSKLKPKNAGIFSKYAPKTDVKGIWMRITLPLSKDRKTVREYCLPQHLSKNQTWVLEDVNISGYQ